LVQLQSSRQDTTERYNLKANVLKANVKSTDPVRWTAIDGIDEKTEQLLYNKGYYRFEDLATVKPETLQADLERGGAKFDGKLLAGWIRQAGQNPETRTTTSTKLVKEDEPRLLQLPGHTETQRTETQRTDQNASSEVEASPIQSETTRAKKAPAVRGDDLTKIEGINARTARRMKDAGILTFADLQTAGARRLQRIITSKGATGWRKEDLQGLARQAGLAAKQDWEGLELWKQNRRNEVQQSVASKTSANKSQATKASASTDRRDDLTKLEGIDSKTAKRLQDSGILTFADLHSTKSGRLRQILSSDGKSDWAKNDLKSLSTQAGFAMRNDWDGLKLWRKERAQPKQTATVTSESQQHDDLTKINGIEPETVELLNKSGIRTYRQLRSSKLTWLRQILKNGGTKFQSIDPTSWSVQSDFASRGDWRGLRSWQGQQEISAQRQGSTVRQSATTSATGSQDLTVVHGIGPATQKLLNGAGIHSFEQIAELTGQKLVELLAQADENFKPVQPQTWPRQAKQLLGQSSQSQLGDTQLDANLLAEINELSREASVVDSVQTEQRQTQLNK